MTESGLPRLAFIIPCYNEEKVLIETARQLKIKLDSLKDRGEIADTSSVYFIDDGSYDSSWSIIENLATEDSIFHGLKLSRNMGHQNALLAGLLNAKGDILISMDADLQHDVDAVDYMLQEYSNGAEIVYGVRSHRNTDSAFKKITAEGYYKFLQQMGVEIIFNHSDYRLMSRKTVKALEEFNEVNLFIRGIIPTLGFKSATVEYKQLDRFAGESKYPISKMLKLAWDGITSFSDIPLRVITVLGFLTSLLSVCLIIYVFIVRIFSDQAVPGWASTTIPIFFIGGVQLLSLGVIGEYIAKIYMETKSRPRYIIEKEI